MLMIMYVQIAMNRHCIPGLTMSTALTGNFSAGVSGIIKTVYPQGLSAYVLHYASAWCDTGRNGRYGWRGKICVVF